MYDLFAWQFIAVVVGVIVYAVTLRYAWEDEGFWFGLWAFLWALVLVWIGITYFPGLTDLSPVKDSFFVLCVILTGIVHITMVISWMDCM